MRESEALKILGVVDRLYHFFEINPVVISIVTEEITRFDYVETMVAIKRMAISLKTTPTVAHIIEAAKSRGFPVDGDGKTSWTKECGFIDSAQTARLLAFVHTNANENDRLRVEGELQLRDANPLAN